MLLQGGETPNVEEHSDNFTSQHVGLNPDGHHRPSYMKNNLGANPMNLEGRALSALVRFGEKAKVSDPVRLHRVQHQQETMEPTSNLFIKTFLALGSSVIDCNA